MSRGAVSVVAAVAVLFGLFAWLSYRGRSRLLVAAVPVQALVISHVAPDAAYPERFAMQVAVLQTATDEPLLPAIHALSEMGIPFFVTRKLEAALGHRLILIYPRIDAGTFSAAEVEKIRRHVEQGGSVYAQWAAEGPAEAVFGFRQAVASKRRHAVRFARGAGPVLRYLDRPEELEIRLGSERFPEIYWTQGYTPDATGAVLARFEDGAAALVRKQIGSGTAYLSGVSLLESVLRSQANRHYEAFRHYVNAFEPGGDVWLLLLRAWYETREPHAVRVA
ncbi:MAG TPA: hypothetical protein VLW54_15430, partial [Candidatus Acidoferrales bacterium]|nr:hypothetical protein [Candidatus Acidoferrales bacterium]